MAIKTRELANRIGVEIGEPFYLKFKDDNSLRRYKFANIFVLYETGKTDGGVSWWMPMPTKDFLDHLNSGRAEVVKMKAVTGDNQ